MSRPAGARLPTALAGLSAAGGGGGSLCALRARPGHPSKPGFYRRSGLAAGLVWFVSFKVVRKYLSVCGSPTGKCAGRCSQGSRFPAFGGSWEVCRPDGSRSSSAEPRKRTRDSESGGLDRPGPMAADSPPTQARARRPLAWTGRGQTGDKRWPGAFV